MNIDNIYAIIYGGIPKREKLERAAFEHYTVLKHCIEALVEALY